MKKIDRINFPIENFQSLIILVFIIIGFWLHYIYVDRINKQGGGVALYIKNKFDCNKVEEILYE